MSSNQIDANGIQIQSVQDIITEILNGTPDTPGLLAIYGADINIDSNTPDGQMINLIAMMKKDMLDLIVQDYNAKDPDQAVGEALDGVSQLCGITRKAGTYTEVLIDVTVDRSVSLDGVDTADTAAFAIQDNTGTKFYLKEATSLTAGTTSLTFRSEDIGSVQILPNTITSIITITLGVTSVNNPAGASVLGTDEESDFQFRARRQASVAKPAKGVWEGLYGALNDLSGVTSALVYENNTNSVDANGVDPHGIWCIIDGGTDADIADIIYKYRSLGCPMRGSTTYPMTQVDSSTFIIYFDRSIDENLYVEFGLTSLTGGSIDEDSIKNGLIQNLSFGIHQPADITSIARAVKLVNPDVVVTGCQVSNNNSTWVDIVYPTPQGKFILTTGNITIL